MRDAYGGAVSIVCLTACGLVLQACSQVSSPLPLQTPRDAALATRTLSPGTASCAWSRVVTPNRGTDLGDSNILAAVAARTASDAWAVGDFYDFSASLYHTLTVHFDGAQWKLVSSRDVGTEQSELYGVAIAGARDAWAVGYSQAAGFSAPYKTLIEHWNGHAWSLAQSDSKLGVLNAAAATGPNDVWAVGTTNYPGYGVIEHYDGKTWSYTKLRIVAEFRAVAAISPSDVWAVGEKSEGYADKTLTFHYDGKQWRRVPSPSPLHRYYADQNWLTSVAAISPNDVWALGVTRDTDYGILNQPLSEHWNGRRWHVVNFPPPWGTKQYNSVWGGTALGPNDVWAVGQVGVNRFDTMTAEWNGTGWSATEPPESIQTDDNLLAAAPDGAGGVWAVGNMVIQAYETGTLAERCVAQ